MAALYLIMLVLVSALVVGVLVAVRFALNDDLLGIASECVRHDWRRVHCGPGACLIGFLASLGLWTAAILLKYTFHGLAHFALLFAILFLC